LQCRFLLQCIAQLCSTAYLTLRMPSLCRRCVSDEIRSCMKLITFLSLAGNSCLPRQSQDDRTFRLARGRPARQTQRVCCSGNADHNTVDPVRPGCLTIRDSGFRFPASLQEPGGSYQPGPDVSKLGLRVLGSPLRYGRTPCDVDWQLPTVRHPRT